ncbi:hypothetical protein Tco_0888745, partial [Tanacetum coccineum]
MDESSGSPPYTTACPSLRSPTHHFSGTRLRVPYGIPRTQRIPAVSVGGPRNELRYRRRSFSKGVRNERGKFVCVRFKFLNRYLPEDRDPMHSWSVISVVFALVLA